MGRKQKTISVRIHERKLPSGKTSFYLDFHSPFTGRQRTTLNLTTSSGVRSSEYREMKAIAEAAAQIKLNELRQRQTGVNLVEQVDTFLHDYFNQFNKDYNKKDYRRIQSMTNKVLEYFSSNLYLNELTTEDCEDFAKELTNHLKKETSRNYFLAFKRVLKQAKRSQLIQSNPAEGISIKGASDRLLKDVLTKDELPLLESTDCGNTDVKRAFLLSTQTGLGYSDFKTLHWGQIRKEGDKTFLKYERAKTGEETEIKLNNPAMRFLNYQGQKTGLAFPKLPTNESANRTIKNWIERTGIDKHITFYCGRHTFGTLQAEAGVNLQVIAKNMGQTSTKHTTQYINHVNAAKENAVDSIGDW